MNRGVKKIVIGVLALGLVFGASAWRFRSDGEAVLFRTAPVTRGDLMVSISATGTVEPEEVIDVGAQVAGQILSFGKDAKGKPIDYGSAVEAGTVLARIDDSLYAADAAQAEAQVNSAKANEHRAEADLGQMKAKLVQAQNDWERAQKVPSGALARTTFDAYRAAYETAKANLDVGKAAVVQAKAQLSQAEATLQRARRNLGYCTITSPVKGVIIDRRVNIGQTVVSSLNAPSLFLIAKDLTRMQVWVAVNEADIGKIVPGQAVSFTVDAFPGETFRGEVGRIRLNASMTQNVVTYTVEIITDNSSGRLLPYLTANVQFELERRAGVLLVPNAALRWTPSAEQVSPEVRQAVQTAGKGKRQGRVEEASSGERGSRSFLWVQDGEFVRPLRAQTGVTDGSLTEVRGEGLTEGLQVITGQNRNNEEQTGSSNPFTPQFLRRDRNSGGGR